MMRSKEYKPINVICHPADRDFLKLAVIPDIHCCEGKTYLMTDPGETIFEVNQELRELKEEVKRLTWLCEHRLKGLLYWKDKQGRVWNF
jgi:hypothetical protein